MSDDLAAKLAAELEQLRGEIRDLKMRMTLSEEGKASVNRRVDKIETRLDAIADRVAAVIARREPRFPQ